MRLVTQIYTLTGAMLIASVTGRNHLDGIVQMHTVMQLEPKPVPATQKPPNSDEVMKTKRELVNYRNATRKQRQYVWPITAEQYGQLLQRGQQPVFFQRVQQPAPEQLQRQQAAYHGFHNQHLLNKEAEQEAARYDVGQQYLASLLQQYEHQARLAYYLQQAGLGQAQTQTNQPLSHAGHKQISTVDKVIYQNAHQTRHPTMPVYHYSPLPKGTFKEERDQKKQESHETTTKSQTAAMTSVNPSYGTGLGQYSNILHQHEDHSDWNSDHNEDVGEYDFGYRVSDHVNGLEMGKVESKENGMTRGSYHVLLPDGRLQVVNYWSDHTGYHTDIRYHTRPNVK